MSDLNILQGVVLMLQLRRGTSLFCVAYGAKLTRFNIHRFFVTTITVKLVLFTIIIQIEWCNFRVRRLVTSSIDLRHVLSQLCKLSL